MGLYRCEECGCVENTALGNFWTKSFTADGKALCTECDPKVGEWHGVFPKKSAIGLLITNSGLLYHKEPPHEKIIGKVKALTDDEINAKAWDHYCTVTKDAISKLDQWEQIGPKQQQALRKIIIDKQCVTV